MPGQTLAIIPARGGSKRVPRKNIREIAGRPLIAHTIDDAIAATNVDKAIVSTEDEEIAAVAEDYGGDVPFIRPNRLAEDETPSADVITHALEWADDRYGEFKYQYLTKHPRLAVSKA